MKSPGVTISQTMSVATIAWRRYFVRNCGVTRPIAVSVRIRIGSSNIAPNARDTEKRNPKYSDTVSIASIDACGSFSIRLIVTGTNTKTDIAMPAKKSSVAAISTGMRTFRSLFESAGDRKAQI